jgi:hypothetical protein
VTRVDLGALRQQAEQACGEVRGDPAADDVWRAYEEAVSDPGVVLALIEAADALRETGWNDADGKCWCDRSVEETGFPHRDSCLRARAALSRFGGPQQDAETAS